MEAADELIPTRATLLERLKDWRDEPSWQEFFDTYWKLIYRIAIKSGLNDAEAQDVVQETMISVQKNIPKFEYDRKLGSFKLWLLNMTRWRITDQFRKRESLIVPALQEETSVDTQWMDKFVDPASANIEQVWNDEWEKNLLNAALLKVKRNLEPEKYQIFDFLVNKEWPPEKVAKTFSITVNQVYLAKHRITEQIKLEVERLQKKVI
ncbi:MAG TPA: sigma-70 family RNA polymerase sigma factor [Verrucomicrobiae bacterium]|jgi:RNA polymerase sigma-70 factor (ECF subfamily)